MKKKNFKRIAKLVDGVRRQTADGFAELYNAMYQDVYVLALSIVGDEHLAQDVVQETFINVYKNISTLGNDITFIAWINRICYRCSLKMIAAHEETPMSSETIEFFITEITLISKNEPLDHVLTKETSRIILDFIRDLSPEYKAVMILRYYEDLKIKEIANSLECSVGTVKSRLDRGRKALRKMLHGPVL